MLGLIITMIIVGLIAGGRFTLPAALLALFLQLAYLLLDGATSLFDIAFIAMEVAIIVITVVDLRRGAADRGRTPATARAG